MFSNVIRKNGGLGDSMVCNGMVFHTSKIAIESIDLTDFSGTFLE